MVQRIKIIIINKSLVFLMSNPPEVAKQEFKDSYIELIDIVGLLSKNADHYLTQVVNFLMWTSAISFGIIAWFAINFVSNSSIRKILGIFGLCLIIDSIIVAIYVISQVIKYWELTWRSTNRFYQGRILIAGNNYNIAVIETLKKIISSAQSDAVERNKWVETFPLRKLLIIHLALLGCGIIFYAITMFV